jgi:hypothetical protein
MTYSLGTLPAGTKGFDCCMLLTPKRASDLQKAGHGFCFRYLGDIKKKEMELIFDAGLALGLVQHGQYPNWLPSGPKGTSWGDAAVYHARNLGVPVGTYLWCDLEAVSTTAKAADTIEYVNSWSKAVILAGYKPGLYVGVPVGLTPDQLWRLVPDRYWRSLSGSTPDVANRSYCVRQSNEHMECGVNIDTDILCIDKKGGEALFLVPEGWSPPPKNS